MWFNTAFEVFLTVWTSAESFKGLCAEDIAVLRQFGDEAIALVIDLPMQKMPL